MNLRYYFLPIVLFVLSIHVFGQKTSVARKTVLFEIGTGVGCANCTSVSDAMDSLVVNGKDISVVKYHFSDQYEVPDGLNRIAYYGITANPTTFIDGKERLVVGGYQEDLYDFFLEKYEIYAEQESTIDIEMEITQVSELKYTANIKITELEDLYDTKLMLRTVLTESHIDHSWFYLNEVNFVCRDMFKNDLGFELDFSEDSIEEYTLNIELDTSYNPENCRLISFVQYDGTQEVMQAVKAELPYEPNSVSTKSSFDNVKLYPNPVKDILFVEGIEDAYSVEIRNIAGQLINKTWDMDVFTNGYNTTNLPKGLYSLTIYANNEVTLLRFVK